MKAKAGKLYDANYDAELIREREACADKTYELNQLRPSRTAEREALIRSLFGKTQKNFTIVSPFYCDYGYNIEIGENFFANMNCVILDGAKVTFGDKENFFANMNCVILDGAKVTFGDNVFIAPNCGFYTAGHPLDAERRNKGLEYAYPITVGDNVWIGANVSVLPGVSIGDNSVIGAGSVVTRSIPANVLAAGNPCRVIREITEEDKKKYTE